MDICSRSNTQARVLNALLMLAVCLFLNAQSTSAQEDQPTWEAAVELQLKLAGENRSELETALRTALKVQRESMEFLVKHMPEPDLKTLSAEFLLENVRLAHQAREESAWEISDELFFNDVLPYANVDETRERWRPEMFRRARQIAGNCKSPGEAAQRLNEKLFADTKVKYSTKRTKANQSPSESMEQGLASCTGLSILLADACRSINVPARLAGIPSWPNKNGNHTWVEVWDAGSWHFTGAAEYDSAGLDRAWFQGDAALAKKESKMHSIYAASYRKTGTLLPMVWSEVPFSISAVNVTDRYTKTAGTTAADHLRVMIRVNGADGTQRVAVPVKVLGVTSPALAWDGVSHDESADTNDFLTFELPRKQEFRLEGEGLPATDFETVDLPQQLIEVRVERDSQKADSDSTPLTNGNAAAVALQMLREYLADLRKQRKHEWEAKLIKLDDLEMKFDYRVFGDEPAGGHSLFISMHGGGGAPAEVNEKQWKNQIGLYEPAEGIYLAPRAPTDTWNLWHQSHIDKFFARIIENAIAIEGVDPNRIYLMGYSAGGDGVYQLAGRMADQLAAAAMMAGHPNDASPLGLRNIGFTLHMGGKDNAYRRNEVAAEWEKKLEALRLEDPEGYLHKVVIHPECGHWMQRKDTVAVDWMSRLTRDPLPKKVVWQQSSVTHDRFYWLAVDEQNKKPGSRIVVSRDGNTFTVGAVEGISQFKILLNDQMVDFEQPIVVEHSNGKGVFDKVRPSRQVIRRSIRNRGDANVIFVSEVEVSL